MSAYTEGINAKVAAAKDLGLKADATFEAEPGFAGFPNAVWNTGLRATVNVSADPGEVTAQDMLQFTKHQLDVLLGKDPGLLSDDPSALTKALDGMLERLERAKAAGLYDQPTPPAPDPRTQPVSPTDDLGT